MSHARDERRIEKLKRVLQRSERQRVIRERITDQQQVMLQKLWRELERSLHTVERQNRELRQLTADLERSLAEAGEARADAEHASQAKSRFITDISHEMRTPMNALMGMLELLNASGLTPVQTGYMEVVNSAAESLYSLTENVLDISHIESGNLQLRREPLDLLRLLERAARVVAPQAQALGMEVVCLAGADLPVNLLGDETRLQQVLISLGGVAAKAGHGGELVLQVEPDPTLGPGGVLFRLRRVPSLQGYAGEDGAIPPDMCMATARRMLFMMGGELEQDHRDGLRFSVRMRLDMQGTEPRRADRPTELSDRRVLVASSNRRVLRSATQALASWGIRAGTAVTSQEVLERVRRAEREHNPYHVALLDSELADASGADTGMRLRFGLLSPPGVHVLCSLPDMASESARGERMGLAGCLLKPLVRADLPSVLHSAAAGHQALSRPLSDMKGKRVLVAEDNPTNLMVLQLYLEETGCEVVSAPNGKVALERFSDQGPDIVLMDIQMPEMDGYEATRAIRRLEREQGLHRTPVVAVTADAFAHDRQKALDSGCDDYLTKPVRRGVLLQTMIRHATAG